VSGPEIVGLGAIAGFTIYIGLPMGRLRNPASGLRSFLNALAIGVLVFLLWDVLSGAWEPVETALTNAKEQHGSWLRFGWYGMTFAGCLAIGLVALVYYDRWLSRRPIPAKTAFGPGAAAVAELEKPSVIQRLSEPKRLALFIALGIGLHNLSEGLAIGQSAASDEIHLALLLIIGFGLHNATEGFGIVGPLAAEAERPTWTFLFVMGLIGGGPTFVGTLIGQSVVNDTVFLGFLALAAGSILYVVIELLNVGRKLGHKELATWGILVGLLAGFATDMILTAAGA
jgi:ZIP family zinc transporter